MKEGLSRRSKMVPTLFIGVWTSKIMYSLKKRPYRHGQLRRVLGNVSQRMLTKSLRNLESSGLVSREVMRSNKPISVEYSLTKLGKTFINPLKGICSWADRHREELSLVGRLVIDPKKKS